MINAILAICKNGGIGLNNKLPWNYLEELKLFKNITQNSVLICGNKTALTLPNLSNRELLVVGSNSEFKTIENALEIASTYNKNIFVIGGGQIYDYVFNKNLISKVYLSIIKKDYECDTFFNIKYLDKFITTNYTEHDNFVHYELDLDNSQHDEREYLNLVKEILNNGESRNTRNGNTLSLFGKNIKFDLRNGFPLLTTKKMFLRGIIEELLFFIKGETDSTKLEEKNINIWKGNTSQEFIQKLGLPYSKGVMGPMYGYQWRYYNKEYKLDENNKPDYNIIKNSNEKSIDQLKEVINLIKTDPTSRRIIMTDFNPLQANEGVLYPCHSIIIQFYVQNDYLDMFCYNRSQDIFLGTPFNIASSALLLMIISKVTNLKPRYLNMGLGDVHIYESHINSCIEQINKIPFKFPSLFIKDIETIEDIENLTYEDFKLVDYNSHSVLKVEMIA
jgi:thymidylate synthase